MEQFESKLKEAERAAFQKEDKPRRWQKYDYSLESRMRQREDKEKQEERDGRKGKSKDSNYMSDRLIEDKDSRHSNKGSAVKDFSFRTAQHSYQSPPKPAFWKPHEDGGQEVQSFSSSKLRTQGSVTSGFRKPDYDDTDIPVRHGFRKPGYSSADIPRWRRTQPKEEDGKVSLDEKPTTAETATFEKPSRTEITINSRENDQNEQKEQIGEDALESKERSHNKSSYSG